MKKFKFIFFFSLILLGTCFYYFSISDYFKIKIVDDVYSKSNMEEVKKLVNNGLKTKDAVKVIAEKYKIKKNDLYNSFIKEN